MPRLVVVSNRIPTDDTPSGGLVVALHDALTEHGGLWIGSSGTPVEDPAETLHPVGRDGAYSRRSFDLSHDEYRDYYLGYANSVLWPLCHHRPDLVRIRDGFADAYRAVNARVARLVASVVQPDDLLWIHDYHFLPLGYELRKLGVGNAIGFFLHIPFPNVSNLPALPEAEELGSWLSSFDIVGLQTRRDVAACLEALRVGGRCELLSNGRVSHGGTTFRVASFPIGIDADGYARAAEEAVKRLSYPLTDDTRLVLGVDRLDYSKGIVDRFKGFASYLKMRTEEVPRASLIQIAPPSRETVEAYQDIRKELERLSGAINGAYSELAWVPIRYIRRPMDRDDLAGLYRMADVGLVTPLADGMNLVAKEYIAAQDPEDPGVLVLSQFAGAAEQLKEALICNPYDARETGEAIAKALVMPREERIRRHAALLRRIRETDVDWWTASFLGALSQVQPGERRVQNAFRAFMAAPIVPSSR